MVWEAGGAGVDQSKEALRIKCKHVYSFASYKTKKKYLFRNEDCRWNQTL